MRPYCNGPRGVDRRHRARYAVGVLFCAGFDVYECGKVEDLLVTVLRILLVLLWSRRRHGRAVCRRPPAPCRHRIISTDPRQIQTVGAEALAALTVHRLVMNVQCVGPRTRVQEV